MNITPMSAPLGARIEGVDVTRISDEQWQDINLLFLKYHVLLFPGQQLTPEQQMASARTKGVRALFYCPLL